MKSLALSLIVLVCFSSCKKADELGNNSDLIKLPQKEVSAADAAYETTDNKSPAKESQKNIEQKIIKEGNLRFESNDLNATYTQIQNAAKSYKATIQNDTEGKDYTSIFRRLIIRVPSKDFDLFLKDISKVIKKDGILILSGIIEDKKNLVINACEKEGLELLEVQEDKEWVALSLRMK